MKIILSCLWLIIVLFFWIFAVKTKVDPEKYEFRIRSIFYWLAVIVSLLIGIVI
jgi:hypothetical protein